VSIFVSTAGTCGANFFFAVNAQYTTP
jgi:hypothetical protein